MQQRSAETADREARMVERAVVLQVLRDDRARRWSRAALMQEIPDFESAILERALARLAHDGVLQLDRGTVAAARATRRLDELELIGL